MKKNILCMVLALMASLTACQSAQMETPLSQEEEKQPTAEQEPTEEEQEVLRREEALTPLLQEAEHLALGYYYKEAIAVLDEIPTEYAQDQKLKQLF